MSNRIYSDNELERLLGIAPESEYNLEEDLMMDQGDGTKGCFNWELRGKGYHLDKESSDEISDIMEVPMGQIRKADSRTNQYTSNLRPCFGVGFYNLNTKESYMLHYPDLYFYDIKKDVEKIKKDFSNDRILVVATGGSEDNNEPLMYNDSISKDKNYIKKLLLENFKSEDVEVSFSEPNKVASLYLDKNLNKFFIDFSK